MRPMMGARTVGRGASGPQVARAPRLDGPLGLRVGRRRAAAGTLERGSRLRASDRGASPARRRWALIVRHSKGETCVASLPQRGMRSASASTKGGVGRDATARRHRRASLLVLGFNEAGTDGRRQGARGAPAYDPDVPFRLTGVDGRGLPGPAGGGDFVTAGGR